VNNKVVRDKNAPNDLQSKYTVNEQIKSDKIYVIGANGDNAGLISRYDAIKMAQDAELDLVQVGERDGFPVAKVMDFGKFVYGKKKQHNDSKKNQKVITLKELKMRPNIGDGDYQTKLKKGVEFFKEGKKVKFTLQFKGREISMMENLGSKFFERITTDLTAQQVGTLVEEKDQRSGAFWSKIYFVKDK
jgi:translation initiation factor IF-3